MNIRSEHALRNPNVGARNDLQSREPHASIITDDNGVESKLAKTLSMCGRSIYITPWWSQE